MNERKRVVITGTGVVSPLGNSPEAMFEALKNGVCSIREMTEWGPDRLRGRPFLGSPVSLAQEDVKKLPRAARRSMSAISVYASFAALQAAEQAGLTGSALTGPRTGCVIGSTMGGSNAISEAYRIANSPNGVADMSSMQFFKCVSHTAAFNVSHLLNISGVVLAPCAACASALQSIGVARDLIASGVQDVVLCGGAEELAPEVSGSFDIIYAGFSSEKRDPKTCSRPFDALRGGLVCGEGAGILVLESLEHARARGAQILAEIAGCATCCCGSQISQSDAPSIVRCLENVYADASMDRAETGYISAHATSTVQGDLAEAVAIRDFFGPVTPPVSSLKGHMGHTLGASGSLELIASLLMMRDSLLIPNLNFNAPDEACAGPRFLKNITQGSFDSFLKNSFAFGGINAAVLCRKYS